MHKIVCGKEIIKKRTDPINEIISFQVFVPFWSILVIMIMFHPFYGPSHSRVNEIPVRLWARTGPAARNKCA